ncbi:MAG TPA: hypothetical protein VEU72_06875 [Nitrosopumilaceae archaeon]|nr:hypothetical protein [Nitrosopumilaceae archaeon]
MKTLHLSIIVILLVTTFFGIHDVLAQNVTNSTNSMPPNAIRTPNGGWITPLQTTDQNGKNLTIHYETGVQVSSSVMPPGPPPNIQMNYSQNISPVLYMQQELSPLQQSKSGIAAKDVACKEGLQLIIKAEDDSPACVSSYNINKLVERGWAKQELYYVDSHMNPKVTLYDYYYDGIYKDNTTVSINNQTYHQTTLDYADYDLKKGISIQFQNVTFAFPEGTMNTPGGSFIMLDIKFQDGSQEIYGENKKNPDGSGAIGGIEIPTQYGPHLATNSTTVLSNHLNPQAGLTIYNDKIKLLVSTDNQASSALKLYLSADSDIIQPGKSIGITISVNNTLATPVDIPAQNNWSYSNVSTGPCDTIGYGISILDGFYDKNNVTQGKILNLFNPGILCPVFQETAKVYKFQPNSGDVKQVQCKPIEGLQCETGSYQMGQNYKFNGYWDSGMVQPFKSGIYTLVGSDEWGHVAIEHFVVTNSTIFAGDLGTTNCPMMYSGVQFGTTIKNSTGFANYYNSTQYGHTFFFLHPGMQGTISVQYTSPANAAWFQNNGNAPFNMTNGAALFYMANVTNGKMITSYAVSLYNDETGHHSQICHYGMPYGGFEEPCNSDNKGDIPTSELADASKLLHPGISTSFEPNSVMFYPNNNPTFTATVYTNSDAMPGIYWLSLERSMCGPGVLAKLVVLP